MNNHLKTSVLVLFLATSALCSLHAQTKAYQRYPYGIGVQFSSAIWGLSYHQRSGENALQGVIGLIYDPDPLWSDSTLSYGVAVDYQRTLFGEDFNDYLGGQIYIATTLAHSGEILYNYSTGLNEPFEAKITMGLGFGVEILFFQNFSLPVEIVYNFSYLPTAKEMGSAFAIDLIPKVSLRYRFK